MTAVALLAALLPAIFLAPVWVWGLVSLIFLAQAAREWAALLGSPARGLPLGLILILFGVAWMLWRGPNPQTPAPGAALMICALALACWAIFMPPVLRQVRAVGPVWGLAFVALGACWLALYELRVVSAVTLLSAMALVWVADIGAYAGGRGWGRRKLAPKVSPGKTWEGALSGAVAVIALALLARHGLLPGELPASTPIWSSHVLEHLGAFAGAALLAGLVGLSITGDLFESALKRSAGVKDSSQVLPGHGGVLDRIDALIPTMPAALLLFLVLR